MDDWNNIRYFISVGLRLSSPYNSAISPSDYATLCYWINSKYFGALLPIVPAEMSLSKPLLYMNHTLTGFEGLHKGLPNVKTKGRFNK